MPAGRKLLSGFAMYPLLVVTLLTVGVGTYAYFRSTPRGPSGKLEESRPPIVRVFQVRKGSHRCSVTVFGTSRASQQWTAIAEVRGEAIHVDPSFEPGEILPARTLLVRIDSEEYELAATRFEAEVAVHEAEITELDTTEEHLKEIQAHQERQLALADEELEREKSLLKTEAISKSDLERAENVYLARLILSLETGNNLALIPQKQARATAARDAARTQLKQAQRELKKCEIRLPFGARCARKLIEAEQVVTPGERLGTFLAMETAEVVAMVETRKGAVLFPHGVPGYPGGAFDFEALDWSQRSQAVKSVLEILDAEVYLGSGEPWKGKVTRLASALDPATRTLPVVIEVPDPYTNVVPGVRPALVPDAFCRITLHGDTVQNVAVIPRDSLNEGVSNETGEVVDVVYVLRRSSSESTDGKSPGVAGTLEIREVSVLALEDDIAVIDDGIDDGDLVLLGDLYPAIAEMPLAGQLEANPAADRQSVPDAPSSPLKKSS